MVEKMKTDVDGLLLIVPMTKNFRIYFAKVELFSISKPKVVYARFYLFYHLPNFENKILCTF